MVLLLESRLILKSVIAIFTISTCCSTTTLARFFDACPGRRLSIGACLAGLCPSGSECINSFCCRLKATTASSVSLEIEEQEEFGKCSNGKNAIGECIDATCPNGYQCEKGLCCKKKHGAAVTKFSKLTTGTTKLSTSKSIRAKPTKSSAKTFTRVPSTTAMRTTTTQIPEAESEERETEEMTTATERTTLTTRGTTSKQRKKIIISENSEEDEDIETSTMDESSSTIEEDENELAITDLGEEWPTTTEIVRTTQTSPVTSKKRKPKNHTTTSIPKTTTTTVYSSTNSENGEEGETEDGDENEKENSSIEVGTCPVGEPIGECISQKCPEGHTCFHGWCCILTPQINCTDELSGCLTHLCGRRGYYEFMTKSCARSCARCHLIDLTKNELLDCRDRRNDCADWAKEGFCDSTLYTIRQKLKFCGRSCKLC